MSDIDLLTITSTQGIKISGVNQLAVSSYAVGSARDINGDGISDIIVAVSHNLLRFKI